MKESAERFDCQGETLVGVLHQPEQGAAETAVLIVVGGPQVRHGAHRQFVQLARALARAGFAVLRFDVRGMGDSGGDARDFLGLDEDIHAALALLRQRLPGLRRLVLWGLCDGASAAALYLRRPGALPVQGLCLVNPWVRQESSLARTRLAHHYRWRWARPAVWAKLLRGQLGWAALRDWWQTRQHAQAALPQDSYVERMLGACLDFGGAALVLLSERDETAQEFALALRSHPRAAALRQRPGWRWQTIAQADHTFSAAAAQRELERACLAWLHELEVPR